MTGDNNLGFGIKFKFLVIDPWFKPSIQFGDFPVSHGHDETWLNPQVPTSPWPKFKAQTALERFASDARSLNRLGPSRCDARASERIADLVNV